jgi:hypothetical protein
MAALVAPHHRIETLFESMGSGDGGGEGEQAAAMAADASDRSLGVEIPGVRVPCRVDGHAAAATAVTRPGAGIFALIDADAARRAAPLPAVAAIPGALRWRSVECLFQYTGDARCRDGDGDGDGEGSDGGGSSSTKGPFVPYPLDDTLVDAPGAAQLAVEALLRCPIDLRQTVAPAVVVIGGLAMVPGFRERVVCGMVAVLRARGMGALASLVALAPVRGGGGDGAGWLGVSVGRALEEVYAKHDLSVTREEDWDAGMLEEEASRAIAEPS